MHRIRIFFNTIYYSLFLYALSCIKCHIITPNLLYVKKIGRKLSAQLRAKIRSLDEPYPITSSSSGVSSSAGRSGSNMLNRETSYVISSSVSGGVGGVGAGVANTVPSSSANMIHNELHGSGGDDSKSLHSDSSLSDVTSGETALRSRQGHLHDDHKSISVI